MTQDKNNAVDKIKFKVELNELNSDFSFTDDLDFKSDISELVDEFLNITDTNMANINYKNLNEQLKMPDIFKDLMEFSGNTAHLKYFISEVEDIVKLVKTLIPEPANGEEKEIPLLYWRAIRNRIKGEANNILIVNKVDSTSWDEIKACLIDNYADQRSEVALIKDLHETRQGNLSIQDYYSKIIAIQTALVTSASLVEENCSKVAVFEKICLEHFMPNLREPLGSNNRARQPDTIAEAKQYCISESNMYYIKYQSIQDNFRKQFRLKKVPKIKTETEKKPWMPREEWKAMKEKEKAQPQAQEQKPAQMIKKEKKVFFREGKNSNSNKNSSSDEEFFRENASEEDDENNIESSDE